jgi:steroid delta-isomerase-like uncharacterized protein
MLNAHWRAKNIGFDETKASAKELRRAFVRDLIVEHVDAENARDMERTLATYSENCVFDDVPTAVLFKGKQSIADSYLERFESYPNLERIITRMTIDDNSGVVEIIMRGPQEKPYRGFPPRRGGESELKIVGHFEVNDEGLITRETAYYDQLAAAVQLGVLPDINTRKGKLWLMLVYPFALFRVIRAKLLG